jgi:hypothetical protein
MAHVWPREEKRYAHIWHCFLRNGAPTVPENKELDGRTDGHELFYSSARGSRSVDEGCFKSEAYLKLGVLAKAD